MFSLLNWTSTRSKAFTKAFFALLAVCALVPASFGQFSNDWIADYDATYLEVKVAKTGIYRIPYGVLQGRIPNFTSIDPANFQVFARGEEQYIFVEGEANGTFHSSNGFVEFFAEKNDGWLDEELYSTPANQPNRHNSLFNDTITYYLTWNNSNANRRMNVLDFSPPSGTPANYFLKESLEMRTGRYVPGPLDQADKSNPEYAEGEGWYSGEFGFSQGNQGGSSRNLRVKNRFIYTGADAPNVVGEAVWTGISNAAGFTNNHKVQVSMRDGGVNSGNATTLAILTFGEYNLQRYSFSQPANVFGPDSTSFIFTTSESLWGNSFPLTDKSVVSNVFLTYPHKPEFGGAANYEFIFPSGVTFLNATNFVSDQNAFIYDLTGHNRIAVDPNQASNGNIRATIPGPGLDRRCYISSNFASALNNVTFGECRLVNGTGKFTDYTDIANQGDYLLITHKKLWSEALAYNSYRTQKYNTVMVDVDELYEQFGYGIPKHPMCIRNFVDFAINTWSEAPKHLFLLGKSVTESKYRYSPEHYNDNLVPTLGFPASDNMLSSGLGSTLYEPAIATGRLSAQNGSDITGYLNKVVEYEDENQQNTIENQIWKKRVLHFGGGANSFEQNKFRSYLQAYESVIQDTAFGGKVSAFYKTSTAPIQFNVSEDIKKTLGEGVALMTFFGHAGGGSFDISIDDPVNWGNKGRYPIVLANSCFTGDIHQPPSPVPSTSESYVIIPDQGAIAYVASVDLGYEDMLNMFSNRFYYELGVNSYSRSLGEVMQNTIRSVQSSNNSRLKYTLLEMTLHGDPALTLHRNPLPDFAIEESTVSFEPEILSTDLDSFDLHIDIYNLGRGNMKPYGVQLTRDLPNGTTEIYNKDLIGIPYAERVTFTLPIDPVNGIGNNDFDIAVDWPFSNVKESDESTNNQLSVSRLITSSDLFPVFPSNYAVIPTKATTLKASTGDPFATSKSYQFQLDTTDLYNSPALQTHDLNQSGGVLSWKPDLSFADDSTVFFWRVTPTDTTSKKWREHSFQYIDGKRGWGQDHFFQFKNNQYSFIEYNRNQRLFELNEEARKLDVRVLGNPNTAVLSELLINEYRLDGVMQEHSICSGGPGINIVVIDSQNLEPWGTRFIDSSNLGNIQFFNPNHNFGNSNDLNNCRSRVEYFFSFDINDPVSMDSLASMLTNRIPDGHYVIAYTVGSGQFGDISFWKEQHFQAFESLGAIEIRAVGNDVPYIFFTRKGHPDEAEELIGDDPNGLITFTTTLENNAQQGFVKSTRIGPATSWGTLYWDQHPLENNGNDSVLVNLYGITASQEEILIASYNRLETDSIDLQTIAGGFPYLRLEFYTQDLITQTAAQLNHWHVLYDGVPEIALNPAAGSFFESEKLQRGATMSMAVAVENISDLDFNDLRVAYRIQDNQGTNLSIPYEGREKLAPGEVVLDTIEVSTQALAGNYTMWIEANPEDSSWVPEQFHFNNIGYRNFEVSSDRINPLLDVTFDGLHILDGDLVSAKPHISIRLKDENAFLLLDDTSMIDVYVTPPNLKERRVSYINRGEIVMQFKPAGSGGKRNSARIDLLPDLPLDGRYRMRIVARDASGNYSGKNDYITYFEVINRTTISHLLNYPNPFTTSTRFVFTITGSILPDYVKIQIMTVTGKIVREITQDELGPLRIGNNMTDYAWDGTDEYGDRLANGVYLYRVITKINGENIEHRETSADKFFNQGFGKMYLMR